MEKLNVHARRRARRLALQALYQWHMTQNDLYEIEAQYRAENDMTKVDIDYFRELLYEVPKQIDAITTALVEFLDRDISDLNPIELTALRIGAYELMHRLEIPFKVAINEAVELTKQFGSVEGYKYVNGVLDQVAQKVRVDAVG